MSLRKCLVFYICLFSVFFSLPVVALEIDQDCNPKGLSAKTRELWDPKAFWVEQAKEFDEYLKFSGSLHREMVIGTKREAAEEIRYIKNTPGFSRAEKEQYIRQEYEIERKTIKAFQDQILSDKKWENRCKGYIQNKITNSN